MKYLGIINCQNNSSLNARISNIFNQHFNVVPKQILHSQFTIYHYGLDSRIIENSNGVILGNIYDKKTYKELPKKRLNKNTSIDELNNSYYGNFIALVVNNNSITLFRDISGRIELCYTTLSSGEILFSNSMVLLSYALNNRPVVNKEFMLSYLLYEGKTYGGTFIEDICELSNGCALTIKEGKLTTSVVWNPNKVDSHSIKHDSFTELMENVISSYIKPFDRIILNFSGGLDSSAILYSLSAVAGDREIIPINFYADGFRSVNEIAHARKIAGELDLPLVENGISTADLFEKPEIDTIALLPNKPSSLLMSWNFQREIYKDFEVDNRCLLMSGYGGDHVFMQLPTIYSLSDAFFDHGYKKLRQVSRNLCQLKRETVVKLYMKNIFHMIQYIFTRKYYNQHSASIPDWSTKDLINEAKEFQHPVFQIVGKRLGKNQQIDDIFSGINDANLAHSDITPHLFHPFLQQPIIEYGLSFPTYELFNDKFNRIPVRKSVHETYNTNHVWRTDKGEATGLVLKSIRKNFEFIEAICCNGYFVKNNLIHRDKVQNHLLKLSSGQTYDIWPFIQLFSAEVFLDIWQGYFSSQNASVT